VELNRESVHAIDVPDSFTAEGPFHVELRNDGGAAHVHLHLDDDLSRVARLDDVNHFVEAGARKRVPIGVRPNLDPRTGRLKIVSGYGAEEAYVDLTVVPKSSGRVDAGRTRDRRTGPGDRAESDAADSARGPSAPSRAGGESSEDASPGGATAPGGSGERDGDEVSGESATAADGSAARDRRVASGGASTGDEAGARNDRTGSRNDGAEPSNRARSTSPDEGGTAGSAAGSTVSAAASRSGSRSTREGLRDAASLESLPSGVSAWRESPEAITFLALAVVAVVVGVGVIAVVGELLLAFVVAAVVAGAVAVAGWLLLG
jgi:hypothetical protein